jgi:uncharacterized membrane protein
MKAACIITGCLALLFGIFAVAIGKTDIQLGMAATCLVGACVLFGLAAVLHRMDRWDSRS